MIRYALIHSGNPDTVAAYLPANYSVLWCGKPDDMYVSGARLVGSVVVIAGTDNAGWTLDDYVLPRLASGMYFGQEIDLSHPIMKVIEG